MQEQILRFAPLALSLLSLGFLLVVIFQLRAIQRTVRRLQKRLGKQKHGLSSLSMEMSSLRKYIRRFLAESSSIVQASSKERPGDGLSSMESQECSEGGKQDIAEKSQSGAKPRSAPVPDQRKAVPEMNASAAEEPQKPEEVEPPISRPFAESSVRRVYQRWRESGSAKPEIPGWDISWMRASGKTRGDELSSGHQLFRDTEGRGDFVRFSPVDGTEGILFPPPHRSLDSDLHGRVFKVSSRSKLEDAEIQSVKVVRQKDGQWRVK